MKYSKLLTTFFKVGLLTIGGGYAMIPVIKDAVVKDNNWLTDEEFIDALAIAQSSPGSMAINSSIYIGYRLKGVKGAAVSAIGTALPSFLIILTIALFFFNLREISYVESAFKGIRGAVVSMIALSLIQLIEAVKFKTRDYIVFVTAAFFLVVMGVNPIWMILAGGVGSVIYFNIKGGDNDGIH